MYLHPYRSHFDQLAIRSRFSAWLVAVIAMVTAFALTGPASAHCDAEDGPVAKDVKLALEQGELESILKWINAEDEPELRSVFEQAMRVRARGGEAEELADRYVLETAVRLHRMSEGAPYTGIKPAGQPLPAPVAAVDAALQGESADELIEYLQEAIEVAVRKRFNEALAARGQMSKSVEHGRAYVHSYVELVHYVKPLHELIHATGAHAAHAHAMEVKSDAPSNPVCCDSRHGKAAQTE